MERIRHLLVDACHELRWCKWLYIGVSHMVEFWVKRTGCFIFEDERSTGQTDDGDDKSERDGEPQVYFGNELFHK
ncbi:PepSY domain-containing protein [Prevotella sp. MGM1]|nr:PepSY domain-containing protein [Prevotella sp. MGM1]